MAQRMPSQSINIWAISNVPTTRLEAREPGERVLIERSGFSTTQLSWWAHQDLNLEPTDYESAALTN